MFLSSFQVDHFDKSVRNDPIERVNTERRIGSQDAWQQSLTEGEELLSNAVSVTMKVGQNVNRCLGILRVDRIWSFIVLQVIGGYGDGGVRVNFRFPVCEISRQQLLRHKWESTSTKKTQAMREPKVSGGVKERKNCDFIYGYFNIFFSHKFLMSSRQMELQDEIFYHGIWEFSSRIRSLQLQESHILET